MSYTVITALWSGTSGAPGYSRFRINHVANASDCALAAGQARSLFDAIKAYLPTDVSVSFAGPAQVFDQATGSLIDEVAYEAPSSVVGTSAGTYAAPVGAVITWVTGSFNNGRRVRGRTFLVPLAGLAFQNDGTLADATRAAIEVAASAFATTAPTKCVVVREADGSQLQFPITGAVVPDRAAILRSRRD